MCEYKATEHKMTQADVRRIAQDVVWGDVAGATDDAEAIVSLIFTNTPYRDWDDDGMYWQPDNSHRFNDYHRVTDEQFDRVVVEVGKVTDRIDRVLGARTRHVEEGYSVGHGPDGVFPGLR
jgi:hypothetical protein